MEKITVLIKEPGTPARFEQVENSVDGFRGVLSDDWEALRLTSDTYLLYDDLAIHKGRPVNCLFLGHVWRGPIVVAKSKETDFCSILPDELPKYKRVFRSLFEEVNT